MYVRLISYQTKPWVTQAHALSIYDEMVEAMEHFAGFEGMSLLLNEQAHRAISLSYWEDENSAAAAGPQILPLLLGKAEELVARPPEVSGFDLVRQATPHTELVEGIP